MTASDGRSPHSAPVRRTSDLNQGSGEDDGRRSTNTKWPSGGAYDGAYFIAGLP